MNNETILTEKIYKFQPVKIMGIGDGGCCVVDEVLSRAGMSSVAFISADTDINYLKWCYPHKQIQLGTTGRAAETYKEGKDAAETAAEAIKTVIDGAEVLFIALGLDSYTGVGAAPVVARIAKAMGILTVIVVIKPFEFEGKQHSALADQSLAELQAHGHALLVVSNKKWMQSLGCGVSQTQAFDHVKEVVANVVSGFSDIAYNQPGEGVDFEAVRAVMGQPGIAAVGLAVASGPKRARIAAQRAVAYLLLEGVDLWNVKGVLVLISASKDSLTMAECKLATNTIQVYARHRAQIIFNPGHDYEMGDGLRVVVVATGLSA